MFQNINHIVTENNITLFWEKEINLKESQVYSIFCEGVCVGMTRTTHFTIDQLQSQKKYRICVKIEEKRKGFSEEIIETSEEIVLITPKGKRHLNICDPMFGAKGDGKTLNTRAIQKAIDQCGEEECVYIPAGIFMTGALRLHSNMELYLEEGAVLQGTEEIEDYLPMIPSRFEGIHRTCYSSVINIGHLDAHAGHNCENIRISGKGTIASGGLALAKKIIEDEKEKQKDFLLSLGERNTDYENENTIPGRVRPRLVNISNARNIILSGVTFKDGASWNVHMIYSDHIITHHCKFYSEQVWNGDGWDPDSSTNCTIFDCLFYTGDDSIAIKSGKNPEGNQIARPCKRIWVFDCKSLIGHGISIGSEISGGIEDVHIWDCDMKQAKVGIEIKATPKRGGYVKNICVENCSTPRLLFHSVGYNDDGDGAPYPPIFEHCVFDNIHIQGIFKDGDGIYRPCAAIEMCGFDESGYEIRDISFSNLKIGNKECDTEQKFILKSCKNIHFKNMTIA